MAGIVGLDANLPVRLIRFGWALGNAVMLFRIRYCWVVVSIRYALESGIDIYNFLTYIEYHRSRRRTNLYPRCIPFIEVRGFLNSG